MSIFENAFSNGVWITLVSVMLAGTFALSFILRRENSMPHAASYAAKARLQKLRNAGINADQQKFIELQERWDLSEILLAAVGAICQQGCARDPSTLASRILYISLLLMATLVLTAFSAVLTAGVGASTQASTCALMDNEDERPPILSFTRSSYQGKNESTEEIFDMTNSSSCADALNVSKEISYELKNLCRGPAESRPPDDSLLRLIKELEVGLARRSFQQDTAALANPSPCQQSDEDLTEQQYLSISLTDVWPAVAQLTAGFIFALFLFSIELIVDRCSKRSRRASNNG